MSLHLTLLVIYSIAVVGVGLWTARFVRTSSAFFVAGRSLGPGLVLVAVLPEQLFDLCVFSVRAKSRMSDE